MLRRTSTLLVLVVAAGLAGSERMRVVAPGDAMAQDATEVQESRVITVTVLGMSCPFCAYGLHKKLQRLEGVVNVDVKLKEGLAVLTLENDVLDISDAAIAELVDEAGFEASMIMRNFGTEK